MGGSVVFAKKEEPKAEVVEEVVEETAPAKKPVVQENVDDIDAVLSIFKR
jgi:hypothetical protein